jgi:hypothetical protein
MCFCVAINGLERERKLSCTGWTGASISTTVGAAIPPLDGTGTTWTLRVLRTAALTATPAPYPAPYPRPPPNP